MKKDQEAGAGRRSVPKVTGWGEAKVALSPDPVHTGYTSVLPNQLWFCRDFSVGEEIVTHTLVVHKTLCVNGKTKNLTLGRQPPGMLVTHNY